MPATTHVGYIHSVTALRGIAALSVCAMHFSVYSTPPVAQAIGAHTAFLANSYLWVDFFFLLSGFVLAHAYHHQFADGRVTGRRFGGFMWARWARIYPLHFAMLAVLVVREFLLLAGYVENQGWEALVSAGAEPPVFTGSTSLWEMLRHLLLIHSLNSDPTWVTWNYPAWTIGTEWWAYMLIPVWLAFLYPRLSRMRGFHWLLPAAVLLTVAGLWLISRQTPNQLDLSGYWGLARCVIESLLGIVLYNAYQRGCYQSLLGSSVSLSLLWLVFAAGMHFDWPDALLVGVLPLVLLATAYNQGFYQRLLTLPGMVMLGTLSYSVYLIHTPFRLYFFDAWRALMGSTPGDGWGLAGALSLWLAMLVLVVVCSYFTYRWIERPSLRWLRGPVAAWLLRRGQRQQKYATSN